MPISLTAAADDDGRRLDRILRKALPDMPLSAIHRLLRKGGVLVDGKAASADYRVREGQIITVTNTESNHVEPEVRETRRRILPRTTRTELRTTRTREKNHGVSRSFTRSFTEKKHIISQSPVPSPQSLIKMILFEGAGLLVLNKPAGLAVHGRESLDDLVRSYLEPKLSPSLSFRPGPLHRLDRPSSGVIAFSTSLEGARFFSDMMRNRSIKKRYLALVSGAIEKAEVWEDELVRDERQKKTFRIGTAHGVVINGASRPGKTALTRVSPLAGDGGCTLILAEIETGRTHQIRAQAAVRGHPLLGDKKYDAMHGDAIHGAASGSGGDFFLHAWRMEFPDKSGEKTDNKLYEGLHQGLPRLIEAPLPENFLEKIQKMFGKGIITDLLSHL